MAQDFSLPISPTQYANFALMTTIPNALLALRSCHSGSSAPAATTPYMLWADTTSGWLKIRNAGDTAWLKVAPLATDSVLQLPVEGWAAATVSASKTDKLAIVPRAGTIKRMAVLSGAATTSSSGNEWQFVLTKYPASAPGSPVALFSGTVGTFTGLGGVGGGAEMVANAAYFLTPDQNATVAAGDVLELTLTKVGSIGNLTTLRVGVEME
jgi:hypothetical protein